MIMNRKKINKKRKPTKNKKRKFKRGAPPNAIIYLKKIVFIFVLLFLSDII